MHTVRGALLDRWRPGLGKVHPRSHPEPNAKSNGHSDAGSHPFADRVADSSAHVGANKFSNACADSKPDNDTDCCAIGGANHSADDRAHASALARLRRQRELLRGRDERLQPVSRQLPHGTVPLRLWPCLQRYVLAV